MYQYSTHLILNTYLDLSAETDSKLTKVSQVKLAVWGS